MATVLFSETVTAMCVQVSALSTPATVYSMSASITSASTSEVANISDYDFIPSSPTTKSVPLDMTKNPIFASSVDCWESSICNTDG